MICFDILTAWCRLIPLLDILTTNLTQTFNAFTRLFQRVIETISISPFKVAKIREQSQKQEETIREQETELDSKKGELQKLKDEESSLEKEYEENKRKLEKLSQTLQDTQLQICQVTI